MDRVSDARSAQGHAIEQIASTEALADLISRSETEPIVLFNHDPWCGTSAMAREALADVAGPIGVVDVARHHDLGQTVARVTRVRHQSPQAIVVRGGRAVWHASHFGITARAVNQALMAARDAPDEAATIP